MNTGFYRGYEYDDIGRIKRVLATVQGSGLRWSYSYDNLGRLTGRETHELCVINGEDPNYGLLTGCGFTAGSESFSYDQVGNRTDLGGVTGAGNRIQSFNGITFAHDADGNVAQKYKAGVYNRQYWWSAEARLDSAYQDSWSKVRYDYDAPGRPVRKWRGDPVNGWLFDRLWVYDGDHRLVSLDPGMNRVEEYAYAPGIDQPIATIRGNTGVDAMGYHVQDELGNILGIIENGAYISQTNSYDAWGTPTETGHAYNNQLKWKGLKWEGDVISLYYMRNRWYDPETGRFMSEDPIGLAGGINLYAFANNDPVNGWDPYGLCPPCILPPVIITGRRGWPFSTPRDQGWSNNFGKRGGGWWSDSGYGDENWNGGNGPSGAEAERALRGVWPAMKQRLGNVGECYMGMVSVAGLGGHASAAKAGARSFAASSAARGASNAAYRYAMGNMFNSKPGWGTLGRAAAADATAFGRMRTQHAGAAAGAYSPEVAMTTAVQTGSQNFDALEYVPVLGAIYGARHLRGCLR